MYYWLPRILKTLVGSSLRIVRALYNAGLVNFPETINEGSQNLINLTWLPSYILASLSSFSPSSKYIYFLLKMIVKRGGNISSVKRVLFDRFYLNWFYMSSSMHSFGLKGEILLLVGIFVIMILSLSPCTVFLTTF